MSIIISLLVGIVVLGLIGFAIWFFLRTPDNLSGYYSTPVSIIIGIVVVVLIVLGVLSFF